jgi:hypothetical protein
MGEQSARSQSEDRSSDQTSKAEQNAAETERASGAGRQEEFVSYSTERKAAKVSARYDIDVNKGEAQRLQRLEAEHGSKRVSSWVDEGMPVKAMGKPRDMEAFREQQADGASEESGGAGSGAAGGGAGNRNGRQGGGERGQARASAAETVGNVVSSSGQSLDEGVQQEMEAKMGGDFGDVQVHTGSDAAAAADAVNARAFTVGNEVAFNKGEYQPGTEDGNKVLAHELAHVRQQTEGTVSLLSKANAEHPGTGVHVQPKLEVSSPDDPAEREAERIAEKVVRMDESDRRAQPTGGNGEGGRGLSDPTPSRRNRSACREATVECPKRRNRRSAVGFRETASRYLRRYDRVSNRRWVQISRTCGPTVDWRLTRQLGRQTPRRTRWTRTWYSRRVIIGRMAPVERRYWPTSRLTSSSNGPTGRLRTPLPSSIAPLQSTDHRGPNRTGRIPTPRRARPRSS